MHFLSYFCCCLLSVCLLSACGGGSSSSAPVLDLPEIPDSPISQLLLSTNYIAFMIGTKPNGLDPLLATSQQSTQYLYQLDANNNITPVVMLDQLGSEIDLSGNLSFTEQENIIPLDVMIMSPEYIMLTVFHRNFDTDPDNDYFNLLVHLRTGTVVEAPVGLNQQGNSGRSNLTTLGRDYFPPDARWNDTEDLYVVAVDFEELDLMISGEVVVDPDHQELVDHHSGVPCPAPIEDESDANTEDDAAANDSNTEDGQDTEQADTPDSTDTTEDSAEDTIETQDTDTSTSEETNTETVSNCIEPEDTDESTDTTAETTTDTDTAEANSLDPQAQFAPSARALSARAQEEAPVPTAIYRMRLGENSSYGLEKVSAEDDRPGLGQFIVSKAGIIIYRNEDGGDNSYRVILEHCEEETGRISTVLILDHTSLILADDDAGNSSIFEVTQRGVNKIIFSCNGNVIREAFSGYSTGIDSLKLPTNSSSIASYDYSFPYFINDSCQGGRLFPQQIPVTQVLDPMPSIPGLTSQDVRGLRKSQMFNSRLYCIGYDTSLQLAVAELDPSDANPFYNFINFNFSQWVPDFDTIHIIDSSQVIFTGTTRFSPDVSTVVLDIDGTTTDLTDTLGGLKIFQQINITPP